MKKCRDCDIEMMDATLYGYPRWIDMDHEIDRFTLKVKTGKNQEKKFLGFKYIDEETIEVDYKLRVCPKCGKVEEYIESIENK